MTRRIISTLIALMLLLQGITLAAADVLVDDQAQQMEHCSELGKAAHDQASEECACCSDADMMGVNCTTQCSTANSISVTSVAAIPQTGSAVLPTVCRWAAGPAYSPLNPPPIS